ncbi:helix-turn-helix domain-containing protein [Catenuloplanes japonicus]|uniref:helix-turn-helix domain-containing protein n=1 Tax=Catenuloplanes japonicus TaxID=33876 RepID=UPI0005270497|nr:helix-turn-helix domain-containing protein [Catenuloplanes japonicus]
MIRYVLEPSDVTAIRFGISPLGELGMGLRALRFPEAYPLQRPWMDRIAPVLPLLDLAPLHALVDDRRWVADFVNPRPASPLTVIDDELAALALITPERLRADLERVHGTVPDVFRGDHATVVHRMIDALTAMWRLCFAPSWARMRAVMEADILYRGRVAAGAGLGTALGGLSPRVTFDGRHLDVRLASGMTGSRQIRGEGVTLLPSMFVNRICIPADDTLPPTIIYPARGQGAMWSAATTPDAGAVRDLLGPARAALLAALGEPASSTELALRLHVTTSAVNQHLRLLARAGLLNSARYGRSVLYYRSDLGESLTSSSSS